MAEFELNIFDATVIAIVFFSCLFAFFRGFVREVLSLAAWIGAGMFMLSYFPEATKAMAPYFKNEITAAAVSTVGLYIGALLALSIVNMIILKFIKRSEDIAVIDNILGLGFGFLRGAFIVSLGFLLMSIVLPEDEYPDWLKEAKTRPYVASGAQMLASTAPEYIEEIDEMQKRIEERFKKERELMDEQKEEELQGSSPYMRRFLSEEPEEGQ